MTKACTRSLLYIKIWVAALRLPGSTPPKVMAERAAKFRAWMAAVISLP